MILGADPADAAVVVTDPVAPIVHALSAAVLVITTWSVVRTVRLTRTPRPTPVDGVWETREGA